MTTNGAEYVTTGALIIGAGAAGLRAAIELAGTGAACLVVGKRAHGDAHTRWAAGGINAALGTRDPGDSWERHFADTLREGHHVADPHAVELLCREAPDRVHELRDWGCDFNTTASGSIDQRYFGAQSFRRTCFVGDRTGEAMLAALVDRARRAHVPWRENVFVTHVLMSEGRAAGAFGFDLETGTHIVFHAAAVLIAAGGCTSAYARSTSRRDENNGDGMVLALSAGAVLRDMEFVQFHPTGLVEPPDLRGRLVSEAVRGEGGRLFNAEGERFMERYSPDRMELDARDVVARAIYAEIRAGRGTEAGAVLIDVSHRDDDFIRERLPKIAAQLREQGVDITAEPVEVAPTAHYSMGGIRVNHGTCATDVPGLFAVGETTAGVHGANRLGGNSLAETVVFGRIAGAHIAQWLVDTPMTALDDAAVAAHRATLTELARADGSNDPALLADEVGAVLWEHAGIIRSGDGLRRGLDRIEDLQRRARDVACDGPDSPGFARILELRYMLVTAELIVRAALERNESRGAHFREDAPEPDEQWRRNILCRRNGNDGVELWTEPVPPVPPQLQRFVAEHVELDYHHLE
jgi:succinate dehydrogenase / fumarate reductase, flavoprotein subunit